jgi:cytochrome c oxidase cbb3-type subunit 2
VLTSGIFKFRSTPSGELPTDGDLFRTISNGVHGTYMPHWVAMSEIERRDAVQYIKALSPRFANEPQGKPIAIPPPPDLTRELMVTGKQVWNRMQCANCHGDAGRGDGPSAATLRDDWGNAILPYDFTRGSLKSGNAPEDIYRAFMTGLNGTPMPSYAKALQPDEAWALVAYTLSLRR